MFNLEQAIADWRGRLAAAGVRTAEVLDELEDHLRDEVEQQVRLGFSPEQAFANAVERIGQANTLEREFEKVDGPVFRVLRKLKAAIANILGTAPLQLSNFSANAKETLERAQAQAPRLHHDFVGTEHVLLGLLTIENSVVLDVLRRFGLDREVVRMEIEKVVGIGSPHALPSEIPYTPRVKRALRLAAREARSLKHRSVRAEHILLGLLREGSGVAALVLKNLGVQTERTRKEILKALGSKGAC
jgi:hypothetical protein